MRKFVVTINVAPKVLYIVVVQVYRQPDEDGYND